MASNTPPLPPANPPKIMIGEDPADCFIACLVKGGSKKLEVISDGKLSHHKYMMMLLGAVSGILTQLEIESAKSASPIIDPFAGLRHRS